ncbi:GyrI-like domain-containing protein [Sebaldella sp. S0638]|uniref:GyrI-like domain-containing protein n=1 Tax=Sebaldella sp. S0638 TaxID=2957809 RepID=UPI00209FB18C|nr:GyrI-like domain-containing protein [Sebaldella sp. S0638]MCP1222883.1 GyrI-like domain-containing protein [Sebaldella sp. S0638]
MNYEIVEIPAKTMTGISIRTTNENMQAADDIGKLWEEFWNKNIFSFAENKKNNKMYGVYTNYDGDYTKPYDFYACCEIEDSKNNNDEFSVVSVPESKYAKFSIRGNYDESAGKLWHEIWNTELDRKYTYDFEVYHNDGNDPENQLLEIYIAVN